MNRNTQPILPNNFKTQWEELEAEYVAAFRDFGASGWYVMGESLEAFEADLAKLSGVKFAVGCASGLDAIELALRSSGIEAGDKVLTTPLTAFATTLAILRANAIPVFADIDASGLVDLDICDEILQKIPDIKFLIPVHLYGHCLDLEKLKKLADKHKISIIEDCAQSLLASFDNTACGSVGIASALSFYPTKNLGCMGDGGALITDSHKIAECVRKLRDYGQSAKYVHKEVGMNSRLDTLQAVLMHKVHLPRMKSWTEKRRSIAKCYIDGIANSKITLPVPENTEGSVWHLFPVIIEEDRDAFIAYMKAAGIVCGIHYPTAIPNQPAMKKIQNIAAPFGFSNAQYFCKHVVTLPLHPYLRDDEIQKIINSCNKY